MGLRATEGTNATHPNYTKSPARREWWASLGFFWLLRYLLYRLRAIRTVASPVCHVAYSLPLWYVKGIIPKLLHVSILDLASLDELEAHVKHRKASEPVPELPFLDAPIGPGRPWPAGIDWRDRYPAPFSTLPAPAGLVMARLAPDPEMDSILRGCDMAILDPSNHRWAELSPGGLYAVERGGEVILRYVRPGARCYYLVTDATLENPEDWEPLPITGGELSRFVKARVLWLGRERDRDLPIHQRGRFLCAVISS
jgi:hypothetical protein